MKYVLTAEALHAAVSHQLPPICELRLPAGRKEPLAEGSLYYSEEKVLKKMQPGQSGGGCLAAPYLPRLDS